MRIRKFKMRNENKKIKEGWACNTPAAKP